jgi:ankyrin repeat protein
VCAANSSDHDTLLRVSSPSFATMDRTIRKGKLSKIKTFVSADKSNVLSARDADGNSLLHRAVAHRQLEIAEFLVRAGADKDQINKKGYTPLDVACIINHEKIIELMLNVGADKNRALAVAVERDCPETAKRLISLGADPNGKGPGGNTLLEHARLCESNKVIPLLSP